MSRTEIQVLLNEPIVVVIGDEANPRRVEIKEPSNHELGEYLALLNASVLRFVKGNLPLIQAALAGQDVTKLGIQLEELATVSEHVTAKVIGEPVEYVRDKMSLRQSIAVTKALLDVIGWEFIRENFQMATKAWNATTPKGKNGAAPSWLQGSSPTSPGSTS